MIEFFLSHSETFFKNQALKPTLVNTCILKLRSFSTLTQIFSQEYVTKKIEQKSPKNKKF